MSRVIHRGTFKFRCRGRKWLYLDLCLGIRVRV